MFDAFADNMWGTSFYILIGAAVVIAVVIGLSTISLDGRTGGILFLVGCAGIALAMAGGYKIDTYHDEEVNYLLNQHLEDTYGIEDAEIEVSATDLGDLDELVKVNNKVYTLTTLPNGNIVLVDSNSELVKPKTDQSK